MLNWVYPDSLHVRSAVWKAQIEGPLARGDRPAAAKALFGYGQAVQNLERLRDVMDLVQSPGDPALALVLLGPVLWARIELRNAGLELTAHVVGPAVGDAVVVTEEAVIQALVAGQISPRAAIELGLIRLYGAPDAVGRATAWFERLHHPVANEVAKSSD